jgi:threonine aldolase
MDPADIEKAIAPDVYYISPTGLICLENSANISGGGVLDLDYMQRVRAIADAHGLPVHLDGARIFNAAVALGVEAREIAAHADSVMFCLSKGLCAPVGSLVVGSKDFIAAAHVNRKRVGGAMRQVGVLGAAGIVALDTIPQKLHEDHEKIRRITDLLSKYDFIRFDPETVKTNILMFGVDHPERTSADLVGYLEESGILCHGVGDRIRFVTYQDLSFEMVDKAIEILGSILDERF